jgi:transposase
MIQITPQHQILICVKAIDFRKGLDGMAAVCKNILKSDPFCGAIFAFTNRSRIFVRLLIYDGNGFWLCHKRFSEGALKWWPQTQAEANAITSVQLHIILQQGDPRQVKLKPSWRRVDQRPLSA